MHIRGLRLVTLCHTGTSLPIIFLFISGFSFNIPIRVVTISTTFSGIKNCAFFPLVTLLISLRTNSYYSFIWHYSFGTGVLYLIHINHQADATIFQFIILTFVYSSTCFGRFPPIIRSSMSAVAASGFTFVSW